MILCHFWKSEASNRKCTGSWGALFFQKQMKSDEDKKHIWRNLQVYEIRSSMSMSLTTHTSFYLDASSQRTSISPKKTVSKFQIFKRHQHKAEKLGMLINNQVSVQQQRQGRYPQLLHVVFVFSIAITVAVACWLVDLRTQFSVPLHFSAWSRSTRIPISRRNGF